MQVSDNSPGACTFTNTRQHRGFAPPLLPRDPTRAQRIVAEVCLAITITIIWLPLSLLCTQLSVFPDPKRAGAEAFAFASATVAAPLVGIA